MLKYPAKSRVVDMLKNLEKDKEHELVANGQPS